MHARTHACTHTHTHIRMHTYTCVQVHTTNQSYTAGKDDKQHAPLKVTVVYNAQHDCSEFEPPLSSFAFVEWLNPLHPASNQEREKINNSENNDYALDPTFGIHSNKTLDIAQPCYLSKSN